MRELVLTNDLVLLSFAETLLRSAGIETEVRDQHVSLMEGSIGAFPRRLLVGDADWHAAANILEDAGLTAWICRNDVQ